MLTPRYLSISALPLIVAISVLFAGSSSVFAAADAAEAPPKPRPAQMAPANAEFFMSANNLAALADEWNLAGLYALLGEMGRDAVRSGREQWVALAEALETDPRQLARTLLGEQVILFGDGQPGGASVMIMEIGADWVEKLVGLPGMRPDGQSGAFTMYQTGDGKASLAVHGRWVAVAGIEHRDMMRRALRSIHRGLVLDTHGEFRTWMQRLPGEPEVRIWLRRDGGEFHALGMRRQADVLTLDYAGTSPEIRGLMAMRGSAGPRDFGPLPDTTLAAVSLNVFNHQLPRAPRLDALTAPKPFAEVMRGMDAPIVLFLGEIPADQRPKGQRFAVPVAGVALHMTDPQIKPHLEEMSGRIMAMMSLRSRMAGTPTSDFGQAEYRGIQYHRMDMSSMMQARANRKEAADTLRPAVGIIGPWLLATSHERFFHQAVDAHLDVEKSIATLLAPAPMVDSQAPIMSAFLRPQQLADHFRSWVEFAESVHPGLIDSDVAEHPNLARERQMLRIVRAAAELIQNGDLSTIQMWQGDGEDSSTLHGRIQLRKR